MLINGKEVFSDLRSAMNIQKDFNALKDIEQSVKSDVDPKKTFDVLDSDNLDRSDFNIFFDDTEMGESSNLKDRQACYTTYSEMDTMEFIHRGLELIADDSSQPNGDGDVMKFYSDDEGIKDTLTHLFIDKLDLNNELWSIIYETIKFGDNFYEVIVDDYKNPKEVKRIRYLEPQKVERIEINGKLSHFIYKTQKKDGSKKITLEEQIYKLFPWQILHFKIENKETNPYGGSLLKSGVRTYKRLVMLEDIMLVYRISRAPERRVFYIDVGNLNPVEAKRFLNKMKDSYRSQSFIDENGNINKKANVMSITSDIFVPVREGSQGTRIEPLAGGTAMGASGEDPLLSYFKDKILKTMNIPPQYMGEQSDRSRSLSQLDTKFGRFIERIQSQVIKGLNKLAALELFFQGYKKEDLQNFKIELTPPSNVKEITEIDLFNQRMALIGTIQGLNIFTNKWILKSIMKLSDKEIADIDMDKKMEQLSGVAANTEGGAGDMNPLPDMGAGEEVIPDETPEEVPATGETPAPEELTASTIVNVLGQEFLVENKNYFFKICKSVENYNEPTKLPVMFEAVAELIQSKLELPKKMNRNSIIAQMAVNELKGLNFKDRKILLYEEVKKKRTLKNHLVEEYIDYEEVEISLNS